MGKTLSSLWVGIGALAMGACGGAVGQTPGLIGDLNTNPGSWHWGDSPFPSAAVGGRVIYQAASRYGGRAWFTTDGTPAGTRCLLSGGEAWTPVGSFIGRGLELATLRRATFGSVLVSGVAGEAWALESAEPGVPAPTVVASAPMGGRTILAVQEGTGVVRLWTSDGTAEGTRAIAGAPGFVSVSRLTPGEHLVYFVGEDAAHGAEVWRTDGTGSETVLVGDLEPGPASSLPALDVATGDRLYFGATVSRIRRVYTAAGDDSAPRRLMDATFSAVAGRIGAEAVLSCFGNYYATDGVAAPRFIVTAPRGGVAAGGALYVSVGNLLSRVSSSGAVTPLSPEAHAYVMWITTLGSGAGMKVLFGVSGSATDMLSPEIWASDGTPEGTLRIAELGPGRSANNFDLLAKSIGVDGVERAVFTVGASPQQRTMSTDGTVGGTLTLNQTGTGTGSSNPSDFFASGGAAYFEAEHSGIGRERHRFDPATGGLAVCEEPIPGPGWIRRSETLVGPVHTYSLAAESSTGYASLRAGMEPGAAGTVLVDWRPVGLTASTAGMGTLLGDRLIFRGPRPAAGGGYEATATAWESDGTAAGTRALFATPGPTAPSCFFTFGGAAYFFANSGTQGLYRYSGSGTPTLVADLGWSATVYEGPAVLESRVVFGFAFLSRYIGVDPVGGGLETLGTIPSGETAPRVRAFGGRAYFVTPGATGLRLTASTGTAAGTETMAEFPLAAPGDVTLLATAPGPDGADRLYFTGVDAAHGVELWMTDGTAAGTLRVTEGAAGALDFSPRDAVVAGSPPRLCFRGNDFAHGFEWWTTNGTAAGTRRLTDFPAGPESAEPTAVLGVGRAVLYAATMDGRGLEVWGLDVGCPADFNGDGFVDFFDYLDFVVCFAGEGCPAGRGADFNGDGFVDFFDYGDFVDAFEAGC